MHRARELQLELPLAGAAKASGDQLSLEFPQPGIPFRLTRRAGPRVSVAVDEQGLKVQAPRGLALPQIEEAVRAQTRSFSARSARTRVADDVRPGTWQGGAVFPYLGRPVTITLCGQAPAATLAGGELRIPLPPLASGVQIRDAVHAWLQAEAFRHLALAVDESARRAGVAAPRWRLSFSAAAWGGIDQGRLSLYWGLIHLSSAEIDRIVSRLIARLPPRASAELWSAENSPGLASA